MRMPRNSLKKHFQDTIPVTQNLRHQPENLNPSFSSGRFR